MTPFDLALDLARAALAARLTAAGAEIDATARLAPESYAALQADLDTWFQLSQDRRRWLVERNG